VTNHHHLFLAADYPSDLARAFRRRADFKRASYRASRDCGSELSGDGHARSDLAMTGLEVRGGIEPPFTDLQSGASPLGQRTPCGGRPIYGRGRCLTTPEGIIIGQSGQIAQERPEPWEPSPLACLGLFACLAPLAGRSTR
jgi:hypothetical protein